MKNKAESSKLLTAIAITVCIVGLISFVVLSLSPTNTRDNQNRAKQKEMMTIVLEWGRLAPFPASATDVSITTEGSSVTRSFRASFIAPKQDIHKWIKESSGINEATPEELSGNKVKYIIVPGGGANRAELTIDYALNKVDIYVSWG